MRDVCRIALRNVWRHPRRTLLTSTAVACSVVIMVVAGGFVRFTLEGLQQSVVYGGLGHVQVLAAGSEPHPRLDKSLIDELQGLLRSDPRVEAHGMRIGFEGLVSSARATVAASGVGVEAASESRIRGLLVLRQGEWFRGTERRPTGLIGQGLADRLGVRVGDVVSVVGYSDLGRMTAADVRIGGIFESGVIEYDARTLLTPLSTARELTETEGASSVVVAVRRVADASAVTRALSSLLRRGGYNGRVATWRELSPVYDSVVGLYRWVLGAFLSVVTVAVVLGVANTMMMAVLERVREIGILRALGFGPLRVVAMCLIEAMCIGTLGALSGVALGSGACRLLTALAIEMPPPPGHSQGYLLEVPIDTAAILASLGIAIGAALVAGVVPSLRMIRGEVVDALRA